MDAAPDVLIVIVAFQNAAVIDGLLDSIPAATQGLRRQVVVVDNGSTDGTPEVVAARSDCELVRSSNKGFSAGINLGVRSGSGSAPAILVLNADTRLGEGSVAPLLQAVQRPGVGIAAPLVRGADGRLIHTLRREPNLGGALGLARMGLKRYSEYLTDPEEYRSERAVDWATGAALCISRQCHEVLGGWDESYFLYSEEVDFCLRARDAGFFTLFVPESEVVHLEGQSGRSAKTFTIQEINRVRLFRRRHGTTAAWVFLASLTLRHFVGHLAGEQHGWSVVQAMLVPSRRPAELNCSDKLMPD